MICDVASSSSGLDLLSFPVKTHVVAGYGWNRYLWSVACRPVLQRRGEHHDSFNRNLQVVVRSSCPTIIVPLFKVDFSFRRESTNSVRRVQPAKISFRRVQQPAEISFRAV